MTQNNDLVHSEAHRMYTEICTVACRVSLWWWEQRWGMLPPDPEKLQEVAQRVGGGFYRGETGHSILCRHQKQEQQCTVHTLHVPREESVLMEGEMKREGCKTDTWGWTGKRGMRGRGQEEGRMKHGCFLAVIPKRSVKNTDTYTHSVPMTILLKRGKEVRFKTRKTARPARRKTPLSTRWSGISQGLEFT